MGDRIRPFLELVPGEAEDDPAVLLRQSVAPAVLGHCLCGGVPSAGVGFEDDSCLGVGEIDDPTPTVVPLGLKLLGETTDPATFEDGPEESFEGCCCWAVALEKPVDEEVELCASAPASSDEC